MSVELNNNDNKAGYKNTRSTKYLLTINNPLEHNLDRETLIRKCTELGPIYYCISDEIGLNDKTPHTHIYIVFRNARSFNTLKKCFESAHIDQSYGTHSENIDYVFKEGKWLEDAKGETNIRESHYESGDRPSNSQGKRTDLAAVKQMIEEGYSADQIIDEVPTLLLKQDQIERLVEKRREKQFKNKERDVQVYYIWGPTRSGKTYWTFHYFGYENVYRTDDGNNPFDEYNGESVLFIDEFHSNLPLSMFLKITDKYPVRLARRYVNKLVSYNTVIVVSNVPVGQQYVKTCEEDPETYKAFLARFTKFIYFGSRKDEDRIVFDSYDDYVNQRGYLLKDYEAKLANSLNNEIGQHKAQESNYNEGIDIDSKKDNQIEDNGYPWEV